MEAISQNPLNHPVDGDQGDGAGGGNDNGFPIVGMFPEMTNEDKGKFGDGELAECDTDVEAYEYGELIVLA